ncbi:type VI secretion system secreted protein VgrG [Robbsia andropogonis]|uniref:type VI secretion system Vgr family protein n=1 Tax=Robbsia andropogonis TaxID=28092 RepID=UPI003D25E0B6
MSDIGSDSAFTAMLAIESVNQHLVLETLDGEEAVSWLYAFSIAFTVSGAPLDAVTLTGKVASITMRFEGQADRILRGIVSEIVEEDERTAPGNERDKVHCYTAKIVPKLWLLTLDSDRSIYQAQSVPAIIESVLREHDITYENRLTETYPVRDYCVQYDESAFAFIARLMAETGIFFCFDTAADSLPVILADAASYELPRSGSQVLRYARRPTERAVFDTVWRRQLLRAVVPRQVIVNDYHPMTSATPALAQSGDAAVWGTRYVYPGGQHDANEGKNLARRLLDALGTQDATMSGLTRCHALSAWSLLEISSDDDATDTQAGARYHVLTVRHRIQDGQYWADFSSLPADRSFRPKAIAKPRLAGPQTGTVVGPSGETVWVDEHGRIKVRMHWDRKRAADEHASCWMRVAQGTAGQGWGQWFLPRIGQEVLVTCVEGDPDRPVVTGSVYNDVQTPPVTLPRDQTQTVLRSRTFGQNAVDGNALVFDDKTDAQLLALQASRAMHIDVANSMSTTIAEGDETHSVRKGNRLFEIAEGNDTQKVKGKRTETVSGDHALYDEATYRHSVSGDYTLQIDGNLTIKVGGNIALHAGGTLSNEAATALTNKAGTDLTNEAGMSLTNKATTTLSNEGLSVSSRASTTQTVDGGGMLTLKGGMVSIN